MEGAASQKGRSKYSKALLHIDMPDHAQIIDPPIKITIPSLAGDKISIWNFFLKLFRVFEKHKNQNYCTYRQKKGIYVGKEAYFIHS